MPVLTTGWPAIRKHYPSPSSSLGHEWGFKQLLRLNKYATTSNGACKRRMSYRPNGFIEGINMSDIRGARGIYSCISGSSELSGDVFHGWQCQGRRDATLQPGFRAFDRSSDDPPGHGPVPGASVVGWCIYRDTNTVSVHSLDGGLVMSRRTAQRDSVRRDSSCGSRTVPFSSVWGQTNDPQSATIPDRHTSQHTPTRET